MPTRLLTIALWLGATSLAVGVGIFATRLVASRVAGPSADITISQVQDPSGAPSTAGAPSPPATLPSASPSPQAASSPSSGPSPSPAPPPSPAEETRTVVVVGGSAALRFVDGRAEVIWATPNAGFTATVEHDPGNVEARVDFRSSDHRSRIKGEWEDGHPSVETEERPDD